MTRDEVQPTPAHRRYLSARHGDRWSDRRRADFDRRIAASIEQNLKVDDDDDDEEEEEEDEDDEGTSFASTRTSSPPSISSSLVPAHPPSFLSSSPSWDIANEASTSFFAGGGIVVVVVVVVVVVFPSAPTSVAFGRLLLPKWPPSTLSSSTHTSTSPSFLVTYSANDNRS
jgi:hypothetical protein